MTSVLLAAYAIYFVLVGAHGNASALVTDITSEKQFVYWILVLIVVTALWESPVGEEVAKPLAALIVLGFLLKNYQTLSTNARQLTATS